MSILPYHRMLLEGNLIFLGKVTRYKWNMLRIIYR